MKGWQSVPFWTVAQRAERVGRPEADLLSVYRDWGVVRKSERDDNYNKPSDDLSTYKYVEAGDLVLNKMKTWQGSLGVSPYEGIVSPAYFVCTLSREVHGRFMHHLLRSRTYIALYEAASKGIRPNQWDLPYDELRKIPVLTPPLDEQRRIAEFLDDRVARIDRIIAARWQQRALVTEHFRSQVEGSLSPFPKMPIRYLAREILVGIVIQPSRLYTHDISGVPALRGLNVREGEITPKDLVRITFAGHQLNPRSRLRSGDVVVVRTGDAGTASVVPAACEDWNCIDLVIVRPARGVSAQYLELAMNSAKHSASVASAASGAMQQHFGVSALGALPVPYPGARDAEIAQHLAALRAEAAANSNNLQDSVDLLTEYKQSLITAAVTGELDVTTAGSGIPS